MLTNSFACI